MEKSQNITLPWPPTVNTYRAVVNNMLITSKKGREFKEKVIQQSVRAKWEGYGDKRLDVTIELYPPDRRKYDIDNRVKPLLDALQESGLYNNDEQVDYLVVVRRTINRPPKAVVTIREISE